IEIARTRPEDVQELEGTWSVPIDVNCWETGTHVLTITANACGFSHDGYSKQIELPLAIDTTPKVKIAFEQGADGDSAIVVDYDFPNTASKSDRNVEVRFDGHFVQYIEPEAPSGTTRIPFDSTCLDGTHTLTASATSGCFSSHARYTAFDETQFTADSKPSVSVSNSGPNTSGLYTI